MKKNRKIAIVHDWFDVWGGSEKVVYVLMEMFPEADLYTLLISKSAEKYIKKNFPKIRIKTSIFQKFRFCLDWGFNLAVIKLFSWYFWEKIDLSDYNLIISSSHSFGAKAVGKKKKKKTLHISYIHTPPKYLYEEKSENWWFKKTILASFLRMIDKNGSKRPDVLVANSETVKRRIKKYYGREAEIIYPPVDINSNFIKEKRVKNKKEYYLWFSRLTRQKGVELAVKTALEYKINLVVVGGGPLKKEMEKKSQGKIKFFGYVNENKKRELFLNAKGLIFTAVDEDFGMIPVEAMKYGKAVIAFNSGGIKETIIDGKNGILFDDYSENCLYRAIKRFEKSKFDEAKIKKWSKRFSKEKFKKDFYSLLEKFERQ